MELVVQLLMLLVFWVSCLKLSHAPRWFVILYGVALGGFVYLSSDFASSQTRDSVASYIQQHSLREHITILVTIEAMLLVAFSFSELQSPEKSKMGASRWHKWGRLLLRFFPPMLMLPTLLYLHTGLLFSWTGVDFTLLSLGLALATALSFAFAPGLLRYLLPEQELRLELLCLSSFFIFLLGLITTVDTHLVYQAPEYAFPLKGFLLALGVALVCFTLGYFSPLFKRLINKNK